MHLFLARHLTSSEATPEEDEVITAELVPFAQALEKIDQGEIVDAKTIVGLLRVWKLVKSTPAKPA
jgi:ADP-ribose pyrophosphatase